MGSDDESQDAQAEAVDGDAGQEPLSDDPVIDVAGLATSPLELASNVALIPATETPADAEGNSGSQTASADIDVGEREETQPPASLDCPARSYGPAAILPPHPQLVSTPVGDPVHEPVDIAMDWLQDATFSIRAVSARGHGHRYAGEVRQDSYAIGDHGGFLWLAVADGVGSSTHSHLGARLATVAAVASSELLDQTKDALGNPEAATAASVEPLAVVLRHEARRLGLAPRDLACTLIVAAVRRPTSEEAGSPVAAVVWRLGDSPAVRISGGELKFVASGPDEDDLINTATEALPLESTALRWTETLAAGETLALVSDGVANIASANPDFRHDVVTLWSQGPPTPAGLLQVVDATVKSFDDDRTFVGVRVREPE